MNPYPPSPPPSCLSPLTNCTYRSSPSLMTRRCSLEHLRSRHAGMTLSAMTLHGRTFASSTTTSVGCPRCSPKILRWSARAPRPSDRREASYPRVAALLLRLVDCLHRPRSHSTEARPATPELAPRRDPTSLTSNSDISSMRPGEREVEIPRETLRRMAALSPAFI